MTSPTLGWEIPTNETNNYVHFTLDYQNVRVNGDKLFITTQNEVAGLIDLDLYIESAFTNPLD